MPKFQSSYSFVDTTKITVHSLISAPKCQLCAGSTYQKSCPQCSFSSDSCIIRCKCMDAADVLQDSVIQLTPSSENACVLDNNFGQLNCSRACPIDTAAQTNNILSNQDTAGRRSSHAHDGADTAVTASLFQLLVTS